jgi:hypothetical protein
MRRRVSFSAAPKGDFIMPTQAKTKKVQIPVETLHKMIVFMECCDISGCEPDFQKLYRDIFTVLIDKRDSMELRDAYTKVVFAKDEDARKEARIAYLEQKELTQL